jgi:hypothetical protein
MCTVRGQEMLIAMQHENGELRYMGELQAEEPILKMKEDTHIAGM